LRAFLAVRDEGNFSRAAAAAARSFTCRYVPRKLGSRRSASRSASLLADLPRSIGWDEVRRMLEAVDRRTPVGRRDYAILVLLITYGLRAREIANLTLDDLDWKRERLHIRERKANHVAVYPLSPVVGEAIVGYLQHARPKVADRHLFFRHLAPHRPLTFEAVSSRASHYLHKAGVEVRRAGSHTLRHTCVQRLVDAGFPLKMSPAARN
jgi:integrase/recombinase XerD